MAPSPLQQRVIPPPGMDTALLWKLVIDRTSIVCLLLCSFVFAYWTFDLTGHFSLAVAVFFLLMPLTIYYLGRGLLDWIGLPTVSGHPFPVAFLTGSLASCLLIFVMDFFSPLSIQWNCIAVLIAAILLQFVRPYERKNEERLEGSLFTVIALIVSLSAATFWTRDMRPYAPRSGNEYVFRIWGDYFIFAQLTGQMRAERSMLQLGDPDMAGVPLPFYHYASYIFPASISAWTGQTAYDSLASFYTPFGIFLTGLAAFALGSSWGCYRAGLSAVIGVLLMPDAAAYGVKNNWYSYHWLIAASSGLLYGIASAALALLLITRGIRPTRWRCIGAGFGILGICMLIKAHIFIVACPLLVSWVVLFKDDSTWKQRLLISLALGLIGMAVLIAADRFSIGPTILPFGQNRDFSTYYDRLSTELHNPLLAIKRVAVLTFGWMALIFPLVFLLCYVRKQLRPVDAVPIFVMIIFLACTFFLPLNDRRGAADELLHRPFVWAYFIVTVWTWSKIVSLLINSRPDWKTIISAGLIVMSFVMLAWPWKRGANLQDPHLSLSDGYINLRVASGLMECAKFLREHAGEEDIIQDDVARNIPILGALAERRCYLSRSLDYWKDYDPRPAMRQECRRRADLLSRMRMATTESQLREIARQTGIRWYVARPGEKLDWPERIRSRCAFEAEGFRVYDFSSLRR